MNSLDAELVLDMLLQRFLLQRIYSMNTAALEERQCFYCCGACSVEDKHADTGMGTISS